MVEIKNNLFAKFNMLYPELIDYIRYELQDDAAEADIRNALKSVGWPEHIIEDAFQQAVIDKDEMTEILRSAGWPEQDIENVLKPPPGV